jgi:hypothetical protein
VAKGLVASFMEAGQTGGHLPPSVRFGSILLKNSMIKSQVF